MTLNSTLLLYFERALRVNWRVELRAFLRDVQTAFPGLTQQ